MEQITKEPKQDELVDLTHYVEGGKRRKIFGRLVDPASLKGQQRQIMAVVNAERNGVWVGWVTVFPNPNFAFCSAIKMEKDYLLDTRKHFLYRLEPTAPGSTVATV